MKMSSKVASEINMKDIVTIATLLRDKGDQVLNFSCKLTLTMDFLGRLNEAFDLIVDNVESSCFQVINTNNSSIEFLHDLQFLHDFVQKVLGLRLWNKSFLNVNNVSLEKFRALRTLDLYEVDISNVDVSSTRDKLKSLRCIRSNLRDLKNLLEPEAAESSDSEDVNSKIMWTCLEEMFLPYNELVCVRTLRCAPNLRVLDLSHNKLTDLSAIVHGTENLEWLNISCNRLKNFPSLTHCSKLKVLSVSDNRLEDLKGLVNMVSLVHLNASRNLISEHYNLSSLMYMPCLAKLNLEGNPITFKRGHRLLTMAFINPMALASSMVLLDRTAVSPLEKSLFPQNRPFNLTCGVNAENQPSCSCPQELHPQSLLSDKQHSASHKKSKYPPDKKMDLVHGGRAVKIREAPIAEGECSQLSTPLENETEVDRSNTSGSAVHLETKRDIESLRKNYGEENWLQGRGGLRILDILGIQIETPTQSVPSAVSQEEIRADEEVADEGEEEVEEEEEVVEARECEESGAELGVFVAQRRTFEKDQQSMEDILLILTDRYIVERNGTNGKIRTRWHLSDLQEVLKEKEYPNGTWILLSFKGRFETWEKQAYFLDKEEAKELQRILQEILEEIQTNARSSIILFTCIRCSANFSESETVNALESSRKEEKRGEGEENAAAPTCPKCGSMVVVRAVLSSSNDALPAAEALDNSVEPGMDSRRDVSSLDSEPVSPFACWGESKLSTSVKTSFDASSHGLQLYVMLNILPDGDGKDNEFNIHEGLVFLASTEESFHGNIVLAKDSIYILRDSVPDKEDKERRMSSDENSEPVLAEWHPLTKCESITRIYSGFTFQFGPQSCILVFPRNLAELQEALDHLCASNVQLQFCVGQVPRREIPFGDTLLELPLVSHHSSDDSAVGENNSELWPGLLVLTTTSISIMDLKEFQVYKSDAAYVPTSIQKIADLVGLNAAPTAFLHQPGLVLHFSGESDERECAVWPWGEGMLLEFVEALRKPWEGLFSIPLETIALQSAA